MLDPDVYKLLTDQLTNDKDTKFSRNETTIFTLKNFMSVSNSLFQILIRRLRRKMFGY